MRSEEQLSKYLSSSSEATGCERFILNHEMRDEVTNNTGTLTLKYRQLYFQIVNKIAAQLKNKVFKFIKKTSISATGGHAQVSTTL